MNREYHGPDHPSVASNMTLLGGILADQGRLNEGGELLRQALALTEGAYGPDHYDVALVLNKLAAIDLEQGDLDAAESLFRRELRIYRNVVGDEHPSTAAGWSNLATIAFRKGETDLAEERMNHALEIYLAALGPDHVDVAFARIKRGRLLLETGRFCDAAAQLRAGLDVLEAQANPAMSWIRTAREALAAAEAATREGSQGVVPTASEGPGP